MRIAFFLLFVFFSLSAFSQKSIEATKSNEKIILDGLQNETIWGTAAIATDFSQTRPKPGEVASHKTEVKIIYDDYALYIAAICYDTPEHVSKTLSQRDDFNPNIDNFQVTLDTYNDDQNGFVFGVSSAGVLYDSKIYIGDESPELNMVWDAAVVRNEKGWQLEMKIPYSAIRFAKKEEQNWGINFFRHICRYREESNWNPIKPDFENRVAQCGNLTGIKGIEPPVRLAFLPYVSGYINHFPNPAGKDLSYSYNGGMDIKYGINEAFTLDMTLVPDFGQVVFDSQVLNLSPFEIQFNENRQFFTEGTELFNKAGLFYSRRIGIQAPYSVLSTLLQPNEQLSNLPENTQLYNATKLSGRTKKGLGIGLFNGLTAPQYATAINLDSATSRTIKTTPLSNYNVFVLDQNLKNNSYVTLTNTNVWREGNFYDANVTGLNTKFNTKSNKHYISTNAALSQKIYTTNTSIGHNFGVETGKQKGTFVYNASYFEESNTYDPNDLGYNANNNKRSVFGSFGHRIFEPFWKLNHINTSIDFSYNRLYFPNVYTSTFISANTYLSNKKFHWAGFNVDVTPTERYDYFESRTAGAFFIRPKFINVGGWLSTNYQKKFAFDVGGNYFFIKANNWQDYSYRAGIRVMATDKLLINYNWNHSLMVGERGFAVAFGTPVQTSNAIVFGIRNRVDFVNTLNFNYTLTNRMGLSFRMRHYRSAIQYNSFYDLQSNGRLIQNNLTGLDSDGESAYNTNFNAFTIDMVYRWVFLPGSEINVVWKNAIFSSDKKYAESYLTNLQSTFAYDQLNSFSIKVLYWLDYLTIKPKKK